MRRNRPRFVGMRWWLALAFAGVAALTAVAVVGLLSRDSEHAFRRYGLEFAVGNSVAAAEAVRADSSDAAVVRQVTAVAKQPTPRRLRLRRRRASDLRPPLLRPGLAGVPHGAEALSTALSGARYMQGRHDGSAFTVGLPIHRGAGAALVAYSLRPELRHRLGVIHTEYVESALIAFGVGAALGLLIATLTARRLARMARTASEIGAGNFEVEVKPTFPDEVGSLALSIEQMRSQLSELFHSLESDRDRLERLLARLDEGVLLVDRDLNVEYANDRAAGAAPRSTGAPVSRRPCCLRSAASPSTSSQPTCRSSCASSRKTGRSSSPGIPPGEGGDSAIVVVFDKSQRERNERVQRNSQRTPRMSSERRSPRSLRPSRCSRRARRTIRLPATSSSR